MPGSNRGKTGGRGVHSRSLDYVFLMQLQRNSLNHKLSGENRQCGSSVHWDPAPPNTIVPCQLYRTVSFDSVVGQIRAPSLLQAQRMPALQANMSPVVGAHRRAGGSGSVLTFSG